MNKGNGYNVSSDNVTTEEIDCFTFGDLGNKKQTCIVKVNGECIRVPDEIKMYFEFLRINEPDLAEQVIRQYKIARKFLDFWRCFTESKSGQYLQPIIEELAVDLGQIGLKGKHCQVSISPSFTDDCPVICFTILRRSGPKLYITGKWTPRQHNG